MDGHIWGRNAVLEALRARRRVRVVLVGEWVRQSQPIQEVLAVAARQGVPVRTVPRQALDALSTHHQGVAAEVAPFTYRTPEAMLQTAEARGEPSLLLILDAVQDPQNLGTLLRTAAAVAVHGVILPKHRAVGVTPAVEKASAGAVEYLAIAQVPNLRQVVEWLKERHVWVVGVEADADQVYDEVDLNRPLALVLGSEAHGISRLVREGCDFLVRLPMVGPLNSLNVAVAGSIVLYEAWRQRGRQSAVGSRQ